MAPRLLSGRSRMVLWGDFPNKETNTPSSEYRQGSSSHWHQTGFLKEGSAKPAYAPLLPVLAGEVFVSGIDLWSV